MCSEPSFQGEWQQPKQLQTELQDNLKRKCESCKEMVETDFLIQPRGQKTGNSLLESFKNILKIISHSDNSRQRTAVGALLVGPM